MTKRQRAALKLAMEYLRRAERDEYAALSMAKQQTKYYTQSEIDKMTQRYTDVTQALQAIEEMIRGEQGVMDI